MVCGQTLTYHDQGVEVICSFCGKKESGHIQCPDDHYICDKCHNQDAIEVIRDVIMNSNSVDPFEIAELAMSFPGLPMLGCQHAHIAGGALIGAIKNIDPAAITDDDIEEVLQRTEKQAHGGYCGLTGVCGITPAIGACFAVLTGSKCGKDQEQKTTMEAVTRVTRAITDTTGPSCCKAYVRKALAVAIPFLQESLAIKLPRTGDTTCQHSQKHPHGCREDKCSYFPLQ